MAIFSWARPTPLAITRRLPASERIYLLSDLHLGDGTPTDSFLGKDRDLIELLDRVRDEGARLVIAGDAIDFHQAWAMSRVIRAHGPLMGELARFAQDRGVIYIWGNHDYDISLFRDMLRFEVCSALEIGTEVLVQHGYEYDPFIGPNLEQTHLATRAHHLVERLLRTWMRLPLEHFPTRANRVTFWLAHKAALLGGLYARLLERAGRPDAAEAIRRTSWYWTQAQLGNPGCLFDGAHAWLLGGPYRTLVIGHSHLPGRIELEGGRVLANTGSWTFENTQYAVWDGHDIQVHDWTTGRTYGDGHYRAILEGRHDHLDLLGWWRENYLGWLRYRVIEEREPEPRSPAR